MAYNVLSGMLNNNQPNNRPQTHFNNFSTTINTVVSLRTKQYELHSRKMILSESGNSPFLLTRITTLKYSCAICGTLGLARVTVFCLAF